MSKIGFLIRARDESEHIGFAIQSVFDLFGGDTKICVVDNDSQDDTLVSLATVGDVVSCLVN